MSSKRTALATSAHASDVVWRTGGPFRTRWMTSPAPWDFSRCREREQRKPALAEGMMASDVNHRLRKARLRSSLA